MPSAQTRVKCAGMIDKIRKPKTFSLSGEKGKSREGGAESPRAPDWLEKALQNVYGPVLDEPMPDELLDLLDRLEAQNSKEI